MPTVTIDVEKLIEGLDKEVDERESDMRIAHAMGKHEIAMSHAVCGGVLSSLSSALTASRVDTGEKDDG